MKKLFVVLLNLPVSPPGFIGGILSGPRKVTISKNPFALVIYVRSFWWWKYMFAQGGTPRAMANGWVIQMGRAQTIPT
jgi:hypothetical protein